MFIKETCTTALIVPVGCELPSLAQTMAWFQLLR
jgi:hypothetical protein